MSDQDPRAGSGGAHGRPDGARIRAHQPKTYDNPFRKASHPEVLEATPRRRPRRFFRAVLSQMFFKTYEDRILGLAAEAGFWGIVSLPSFALSVFGAIGYFRGVIGEDAINSVRHDVLRAARTVLTPNTVNTDVAPLVNQILARGQPAVISIGFLIALWAGSTCMADYVNTITVAYEQRGLRPWWRTRVRSLYLYVFAVAAGIVILPALALGPNEISKLFPHALQNGIALTIQILYIPVVGLGSVLVVAALYRLSLPHPIPLRRGLPGAVLAVALWLSGSFAVRVYLASSFHNRSAYGALSAPIAALIFFYVTALAVLLGAELNSAIDVVHARPAPVEPRYQPNVRQRLAHLRARRWRRRWSMGATTAPRSATFPRPDSTGSQPVTSWVVTEPVHSEQGSPGGDRTTDGHPPNGHSADDLPEDDLPEGEDAETRSGTGDWDPIGEDRGHAG